MNGRLTGPGVQSRQSTVAHGVTKDLKHVVVVFSEPAKDIMLTPDQAVAFAQQVLENAKTCDPKSVAGYAWPPLNRKVPGG